MLTMTWEEFLAACDGLLHLSMKFEDGWEKVETGPDVGQTYLKITQKVEENLTSNLAAEETFLQEEMDPQLCDKEEETQELITVEYHVVYSLSYQVPMLFFRGYRCNGALINLEDSWKLFHATIKSYTRQEMLSILTQMDHPLLFKPFFCLHPCTTAEILGQTSDSKNKLITFLSVFGPYVHLKLSANYGMCFNEPEAIPDKVVQNIHQDTLP